MKFYYHKAGHLRGFCCMPFLYPNRLFKVVDYQEPSDWITEIGEDGERYAYPPPLNTIGFFEDFFEGEDYAVVTFWQVVNQKLTTAEAV